MLKSEQAAAAIEAEYREYKKTGNRGELAQVTEELNRLSMQEWELERQRKQLSEQKMPLSLQTENTGADIQAEMPGSSTTGLTAEEEERLAFLDDYFAAGLNHTDGREENLIKLREQKRECRSKIRQAKRLSGAAVFLAAAGVILGILLMAVLQKLPVAVFGGLAGIAGVALFFLVAKAHGTV